MKYVLLALTITIAALKAMEPTKEQDTQATGTHNLPIAPPAPDAPIRLSTTRKFLYAVQQIKAETAARPLDQFIPIEGLRRLIAQYASVWVPYRTMSGYGVCSPYQPLDIHFSQFEDALITIEREDKNYDNYFFHTVRNIKTKEAVHRQPTTIYNYNAPKLSFYGNYLVHFPGGGCGLFLSATTADGKINKQWPDKLPIQTYSSCCSEKNPLVACGAWDVIVVSDIQTAKLQKLSTRGFYADAMAISPNGQYLAANLQKWCGPNGAYDKSPEKPYIAIFELPTGKLVKINKDQISIHKAKFVFSPDSKTLVAYQKIIYFVNLENNAITTFDPKHQFATISMSYSQDGKLFATTTESETAIWGHNASGAIELVQSIEHIKSCQNEYDPVKIAFSPLGKYMAIGQYNYRTPGVITIWKNNADVIIQGTDEANDQNLFDQAMPIGERVKERIIEDKVIAK